MAGPNLMIERLRRMDLLCAAYLATCDPLDKGTHISPSSREGYALCHADPLATLEPLPETMLLEVPTPCQRTQRRRSDGRRPAGLSF